MALKLALENEHRRDKHIEFEESTHVYTIDGDSNYKSVTTWIHDFFPKFDADKIIGKMRKGRNWGPDNKYYGMTDEEIKDSWSKNGAEAAKEGTNMHLNIEYYYNDHEYTPGFAESKEHKLFKKYLRDHRDYKAYRTEWTIFSKFYRLAGSIDMIYCDPKKPGCYIIADWKRSKEIKYSNRWDKGFSPVELLDDCNYNHYCLQLNVYRTILENYYGLPITKMFLVILHPNQDDYVKIPVPRIEKEIGRMFKARKLEISKL